MNIIGVSGNLTATPELKTTQSGLAVCSFTVAVRRPHVQDTTDFIPCVAWRQSAEFVSRYFQKGQRIEVTGCLTTRTYEDKNGNKRTAFEILCNDIGFGERKQTDAGTDFGQAPRSEPAFESVGDDDLPF